jgi:energy-coupling factor transporter ATP-binding protein EcfA2
MSIEISHLSFTYAGGTTKVLDDVSLSVPRGGFVGVVGPSGCGKTTLARCLNGLIPHFHFGQITGRVTVDGWDTQEHPAHELAEKVGLVFQNPENQLVSPTAEREIAFGPENLGIPRTEIHRRVERLLKSIRLTPLRDKPPYELSGGEQQQVAIAATLALQPKILVLDEPTSNLDPLSAFEVFQLLRELNQDRHLTIVLIEHRLELVAPLVRELLVLDAGRIIARGPPSQVLVQKLVADAGVAIPKVVQLVRNLKDPVLRQTCPLSVDAAVRLIRKEVSR